MTKRVLRQLIRDRRTFAMMIFMPVLIMLIFGTALSGQVKNVNIIVLNEDAGGIIQQDSGIMLELNSGANLVENLKNDDRIIVNQLKIDFNTAKEKIESGEYKAVILIPSDFTQSIIAKRTNPNVSLQIIIHIDATKPAIQASIMSALNEGLQDSLGSQTIEFQQTLAYGDAEFTGLDTAVPGVISLVLTFLVLMISVITIVREQQFGTLGRIYTTPLTKAERLLGFVLALTLIGMMMVASVFLIATLVFKADVRGNFALLLFSALLYALTHVFLAIFLSNFTANELQAIQFSYVIAFPSMALSGMLVPVESLPNIIQPLAEFIPMTYGIRIFEGIMLKGFTFNDLIVEYLILNLFTIIAFILALVTVKDRLD